MTTYYNTFDPSAFRAGADDIVARSVVFATGSDVVPAQTLLGRVTGGGSGTATAKAGMHGNATASAVTSVLTDAVAGKYKLIFTAATAFDIFDPNGDNIGVGATGTAVTDPFTITLTVGNTPMQAGDEWDVVITAQDKYIPSVRTATDGSQVPVAISVADVDVTGGDVVGPAYFQGTFAAEKLLVDATWTWEGVEAAFRQNGSQLYLRSLGNLG